ncbi:sugar ABC transporter ATP-binding protein [Kaistia algarum]|uniref:sugar ABC transporter ATP-binding protein n=1 Tax=Kaistia algarum TaxID=2083279 RepID=UPI000CE7279A|nr:sugar ABC transporter ATP-binding protein [Kaistia algarum]MCX5513976.1 sugar ABC transporter ATP-binding protein [Kaistia algarum]PPE78055.1 sugar ABC transporter ATP-binding protein [Kaistia algarum]
MNLLLEAVDIHKSFGSVKALAGVSLKLEAGSVHAVLGENGAGKSTLMKTIAGVFPPTSGQLRFKGRDVSWRHAEQASEAGVSTIFQEFILLPNLSVAENLYLGREPRTRFGFIDRKAMARESRTVLERLGLSLDPERLTGTLGVAEQQMVEIAKGVMREADVFVFDEPTAALGDREAERLFALIRELQVAGKGILYVSHRLPEIFALCGTVTVLKDGQYVGSYETAKISSDELVAAMVGRNLDQLFPPRSAIPAGQQAPVVAFEGVAAPGLKGPVNFSVGRHEIVGLAGLEGHGQIEITRALFEGHKLRAGSIRFDGKPIRHSSAAGGIAAGLGLIPEDRKSEGLYLSLGVDRNIVAGLLPGLPLAQFAPDARAPMLEQIRKLSIRLRDPGQPIGDLSGGNQQKALLARWLVRDIRMLICEEPTRGVDIGAKAEIYALLRQLADSGIPVLATSRELPELIGLCDRIVVLRDGATVGSLPAAEATENKVMRAAIYGEMP